MATRTIPQRAMLGAITVAVAAATVGWFSMTPSQWFPLSSDVSIPFTLANGHIVLSVGVNDSAPLSFLLDTGDKYALLDMDRARELHVTFGRPVTVGGTSATSSGAFISGARVHIPGLSKFSQPVTLAIPLRNLSPRLGQDIDGLLGADFISAFVVEVDYERQQLRLHDREAFRYDGTGESLSLALNSSGFPVIGATVVPTGQPEVSGAFVLDLGANNALTLHSPFVADHHLPGPAERTVRVMGMGGVGGDTVGRLGRVASLRLGRILFNGPPTVFSHDTVGAHASAAAIGSIGSSVGRRLRLFLDYSHRRLIIERTAHTTQPFTEASSGLQIEAEGKNYHSFRITGVLEDSPGAEVDLQPNDVIVMIDDQPGRDLTLTMLLDLLEQGISHRLVVQRADQTRRVTIHPRPLA